MICCFRAIRFIHAKRWPVNKAVIFKDSVLGALTLSSVSVSSSTRTHGILTTTSDPPTATIHYHRMLIYGCNNPFITKMAETSLSVRYLAQQPYAIEIAGCVSRGFILLPPGFKASELSITSCANRRYTCLGLFIRVSYSSPSERSPLMDSADAGSMTLARITCNPCMSISGLGREYNLQRMAHSRCNSKRDLLREFCNDRQSRRWQGRAESSARSVW